MVHHLRYWVNGKEAVHTADVSVVTFSKVNGILKITNIELFQINPKLAARYADQKPRFAGMDQQTVLKVSTDNGIVGYGDCTSHVAMSDQAIERLIDRAPFDFVNGSLPNGLMGALYDVMGKHIGQPAYKLMGPKVRDRVPVAAWTRSTSPEDLAREIQRAAAEGYMMFKMHTAAFFDVLDLAAAAEAVAPSGFKMHFDFNHNRPAAQVIRLIYELEKSPVMGVIEDPLVWSDIAGWRRLREQTMIPLLMHVPQLGGGPEIINGCADMYMVGHGLGPSLARGYACAEAKLSTVVQCTGGTLAKALALHLGAVIPNVSHSVNLDDLYAEDVTGGRIEIEEGSSPVPESPGLGVDVDEQALERIKRNPVTVVPRYISRLLLPGGHIYHSIGHPDVSRQTGFMEGNIRGVRLEIWEEDGSAEWRNTYDRLEQSGISDQGYSNG